MEDRCYFDQGSRTTLFLLDNRGVRLEQIVQWVVICYLPFTIFMFVYAGFKAYKTYGRMTFDSGVCWVSAVIDSTTFYQMYIQCQHMPALLNLLLQTSIILYIFHMSSYSLPDGTVDRAQVFTLSMVYMILMAMLLLWAFVASSDGSELGPEHFICLRVLDVILAISLLQVVQKITNFL